MTTAKEKFEEACRLRNDLKASNPRTLWVAAQCLGIPQKTQETIKSMYPEDQEVTLIEWILIRRYGSVLAERLLYPEDVS